MVPDDRSARRGRSTCQTDRAVSRGSRGASAGLRRGACPARGLRLRRPRQWGACWLACHLWDQLRLDDFWLARLPTSRQGTPWLNVLKALVCYRLIDPGSEWRLHRQWFDQSAIGDLLGEDFALVGKDNPYRKLVKRLQELRQQKLTRDQLLIKLGAARKEAGPAVYRILDLQLPDKDQPVTPETFGFRLNWQRLREARRRERQLSAALEYERGRSGTTFCVLPAAGRGGAGVQGTEGRSGDPPDLPPHQCAHRGAHFRGVHRLLSADHAEATPALPGARPDPSVDAGQDGRDPDGRRASADDGWPHRRPLALHRTRSGSGAPAPAVEDAFARSAATQDHLGGCSQGGMTGRLVVPTLAGAPPQNQSLGGFRVASCESRASVLPVSEFRSRRAPGGTSR